MNKKFIPITLALTLSVGLVGCAKKDVKEEPKEETKVESTVEETTTEKEQGEAVEYKDGTYDVEAAEASHGWLSKVTVTVEGGKITELDYREEATEDSEDGKVKVGDLKNKENYEYEPTITTMEAVTAEILKNNGTVDLELDEVSGATNTKGTIVELVEKALEQAK